MLNIELNKTILGIVAIPVVYWIFNTVKWIINLDKIRSRVNALPGPPLTFILGNYPQIPLPKDERFLDWVLGLTEEFPYIYRFQINPFRCMALVNHPDTIKLFLKSSEPKGGGYVAAIPWLGRGLLLSDGPQWFRNRRLLTPAFHFDILKPYMDIYNDCMEILLDKWSERATTEETLPVYGDVSLCSLNAIMKCAFSFEEDVQNAGQSHPYIQAVNRLTVLITIRQTKPMNIFNAIYKRTAEGKEFYQLCDYVHEVADNLIHRRKQQLQNNGVQQSKKGRLDFLDILLSAKDEDGKGLSDQEIRQEVDTFLFEGHDTTASGLSWIIYCLAKHPEIQESVREEIDAILDGRETSRIEWDDLTQMPYTTMCIKEALRMYPPVFAVSRRLTRPMVVEGVELLPETDLAIAIYAMHHNPAVWGEDHMEFKPERFTLENMNKMDSYAYCPFSAGTRNCIGQNFAMNEVKTFVARLVHRYILELDPSTPTERPVPNLVLRPKYGVQIKLKNRPTH